MASNPPKHFALALYPGFQLLDVAGPLDMLNSLSLTHEPASDITLTIMASTLDPVPVKPIPPIDPETNKPKYTFASEPGFPTINNKTNTLFNQSIVPTTTFSAYLTALKENQISDTPESKHKPIDVLLIPGGIGSRVNREAPTPSDDPKPHANIQDILTFIPQVSNHIRHSIVTVCTGSDILAQTGLLDHRRATTNMMRFDTVAARTPSVQWLKARWVRSLPEEGRAGAAADQVFPREIWTSAGISAGMDVMLAFIGEVYGGVEVARRIARALEYQWREIPEGEIDLTFEPRKMGVGP